MLSYQLIAIKNSINYKTPIPCILCFCHNEIKLGINNRLIKIQWAETIISLNNSYT